MHKFRSGLRNKIFTQPWYENLQLKHTQHRYFSVESSSPKPSRWTFGRVLKYCTAVTTIALGAGYFAYPELTGQPRPVPSIVVDRLPKKFSNKLTSNERMIVRRMSDTLEIYRESIREALNVDPDIEDMKSHKKQIEKILTHLHLTKDQLKIIEEAESKYHRANLLATAEILEYLHTTNENETNSNNLDDPQLAELLEKKKNLELAYLLAIVKTLSTGQYTQLVEVLKKIDPSPTSLWNGLLNGTPALVPTSTQRVVYVLNFKGDIMASQVTKLRKEITAVIESAEPKRGDEVVILINSSGGAVSSYGLAAAQLERIKAAGLQLTVCIDEVAASGGYLMACVADRVIASPFATIGSIGVIAVAPNFYERLQREGVQVDDVTAGKYKRTLTPYRKWNSADKVSMQKDVDAIHEIFKGFVKRYRPQVKINEVATGQVWLGYDALKKGLCDELRTSDDVLLDMIKSDAIVLRLSSQPPPTRGFGPFRQSEDNLEYSGGGGEGGGGNNELLYFFFSLVGQFLNEVWSTSSSPSPPSSHRPSLSYEDRVMISFDDQHDEW